MEIKNNKDMVPFEHYRVQYAALNVQEVSERCGVQFDGNAFELVLMGKKVNISFPDGELLQTLPMSSKQILPARLLLMRYLINGKLEKSSGKMLAYRDMPWGEVYNANFSGRCIKRVAFTFGNRVDAFARAMEKCRATRSKEGDVSYTVKFLDGLELRFIIWEGDDEFPPSAQILFSDNFSSAFTAEDMAVVGDVAIDILKTLAQEE